MVCLLFTPLSLLAAPFPDLSKRWSFSTQDRPAFAGGATPDGNWQVRRAGELVPQPGTFWYRQEFVLKDGTVLSRGIPVFLALPPIDDVDQTYLNGQLIGSTGSESPPRQAFATERIYRVPSGVLRVGRNVIAIRVTNAFGPGGLRRGTARLIPAGADVREIFRREYLWIGLSFAFLVVGLYFALLWLHFRERLENIYFALFCIGVSLYWLVNTQEALRLMPDYSTSFRVRYLLLFPLPLLFYHFLVRFLVLPFRRPVLAYHAAIALLCLTVASTDSLELWIRLNKVWQYLLLPFMAFMVLLSVHAWWKLKNREAGLLLSGLVFFVLMIGIDVVSGIGNLDLEPVAPYGFPPFVLMLAVILADRYVQLYRHNRELSKRLQGVAAYKDEFLSRISHEIRTPLTEIMAEAEMLQEGVYNEAESRESRQRIRQQTTRLNDLLQDTVLVRDLESAQHEIYADECRPSVILEIVREELADLIQERGISLHLTDESDGAVQLRTDPYLLERIVFHVLQNAMLYNRAGGNVRVSLSVDRMGMRASVSDEGQGIAPDIGEHVFEKFVRGDMSLTASVPGTGMGLALARLAARRLGGDLHFQSGRSGTTFVLHLPLEPPARVLDGAA